MACGFCVCFSELPERIHKRPSASPMLGIVSKCSYFLCTVTKVCDSTRQTHEYHVTKNVHLQYGQHCAGVLESIWLKASFIIPLALYFF